MKDWMAKLIESIAGKYMGRWVTKAVTVAATWLIAHKLLTPEQQGGWVSANADWIVGMALAALSAWLSKWQHETHVAALAQAAITGNIPGNPPVPVRVPILPGAGPGADIPAGGDRP